MAELEHKRIFLVASSNDKELESLTSVIEENIKGATIFTAKDGSEVLFKAENVTPHVVILDCDLSKMASFDVVEQLLRRKERIAIIIIMPVLDEEKFVDQVVTGQVHVLLRPTTEKTLIQNINRALNWITNGGVSEYRLRFVNANEVFFKEGDVANSVYLVKSGKMKAYKSKDGAEVFLGYIHPGEFVGEMAYLHGETRSANVMSLTDCELIEIPLNSFETVLFTKPSWSKALMKTLSTRLKTANGIKDI